MHVNKWMYKHLHSWHHRLYVPYAYGALYNHPVEGFLLDSLGAAIAEFTTGMNTRQALVLFVISTLKTVDDHCGYKLPFDPLQLVTNNNADYHDIHHQVCRHFVLPIQCLQSMNRSLESSRISLSRSSYIGILF
jgi:sphinganine C4-monooxygenase